MRYSLNELYRSVGITKQAVWDYQRRKNAELETIRRIMRQVDQRRREHPGEGLEKLYWQLNPTGLGRDRFCEVFKGLGYGLKRRRNPVRTTVAAHKVFDNLIENQLVDGPNQVWQSDITYIKIGDRFYYLTFIIDVYTKLIVGYAISDSLRAEANRKALKMALNRYKDDDLSRLIHHSDRGSQYIDGGYLQQLRSRSITISMGRKAQDNAYAERINGIIKNEYLYPRELSSYNQLTRYTRQAVKDYNTKRHHYSLHRCSPVDFEKQWHHVGETERPMIIIRSKNTPENMPKKLEDPPIQPSGRFPYCPLILN